MVFQYLFEEMGVFYYSETKLNSSAIICSTHNRAANARHEKGEFALPI
jgi:hypothetical protein